MTAVMAALIRIAFNWPGSSGVQVMRRRSWESRATNGVGQFFIATASTFTNDSCAPEAQSGAENRCHDRSPLV